MYIFFRKLFCRSLMQQNGRVSTVSPYHNVYCRTMPDSTKGKKRSWQRVLSRYRQWSDSYHFNALGNGKSGRQGSRSGGTSRPKYDCSEILDFSCRTPLEELLRVKVRKIILLNAPNCYLLNEYALYPIIVIMYCIGVRRIHVWLTAVLSCTLYRPELSCPILFISQQTQ